MIGAIIGDIAGSRFERVNHKAKDFELFNRRCRPTDDSVMSLAVARAILECDGDYELLSGKAVSCMQDLGRTYRNAGYGGSFIRWIMSDNPKPYNSYGNGSAMRVSPCGFAASSLDEAKELSAKVTVISHDHPEGVKGAEAIAVAIYLAREGHSKDEIRDYIQHYYYAIDFTIDQIRDHYSFDVSCQGSVPVALQAFFESEDFEDAIRIAVSVGGDSDTIAAMTGSVSEAFYGVPEELVDGAIDYLDAREMEILYYFEKAYPSRIQSDEGELMSVFDYLDEAVDKIIPAGTEICVDEDLGGGAAHAWVDNNMMIPDFSSFGDKADFTPTKRGPSAGSNASTRNSANPIAIASGLQPEAMKTDTPRLRKRTSNPSGEIEIFTATLDTSDFEKQGYRKIEDIYIPEIAMLARSLAEQIGQKTASEATEKVLDGAYKVVVKEGMHLAKSTNNEEAYRALLFSDEGNKLKGQAELLKIDGKEVLKSPQIISGVFGMMSFATGQYYMSVINKNLESISDGISEIQGFLKNDKAASLKADSVVLYRISRDLENIMSNPAERQAVLSELKTIRRNAIANMEFFKSMTEATDRSFYEGSKPEKMKNAFREFEEYYPQYWCAVFNYVMAESLCAIVAEMSSPEYIQKRKKDIEDAIIGYRKSFEKSVGKLNRYIKHSRSLNKRNILPKELTAIADALPPAGVPLIVVKAAMTIATEVDSKVVKDAKKQKKKAIHREERFIDACSNIEPLAAAPRMLDEYCMAQNSGIEMIVDDDTAYIRFIEDEEE